MTNVIPTTYWRRKVVLTGTTCSFVSAIAMINLEPSPTIVDGLITSESVCAGSSTNFTALQSVTTTPTTPFGLQWQIDDGTGFRNVLSGGVFTGENSQVLNIGDVTGLGTLTLRCVATNATPRACSSRSANYTLQELPLPDAISFIRRICEDATGAATAQIDLLSLEGEVTNSSPSRTVAWHDAANIPITDPAHFPIINTLTVLATVSDATTGCEATASVALSTKPLPVATAVFSTTAICSGSMFDVTLQGADQYAWTVVSPPEINGALPDAGTGIHNLLVNSGATTQQANYTIIPTKEGCTGDDLQVVAIVHPTINSFTVTGGGSLCQGDAGVVVGLTGSQPNVDYFLRFNNTNIGPTVHATGGPLAFPIPVTNAGNYTATASIGGLCETPMAGLAAVQVKTIPQGTGMISGEGEICEGTSHPYTAAGWTNADDYRWTLPSELSGASADGQQKDVMADAPGMATLTVEPHNTCGSGSPAQKSIIIKPKPAGSLVLPSQVYVGVPFSPAFQTQAQITQWQWAFGDGDVAQQQQPEKIYTQPGSYTLSVQVIDSEGCSQTVDTEIAAQDAPVLNAFSIKNVITANGDPENAFLFVQNLDKFPANEVVLINRWGGEVFRQRNYANDWDARAGNGFLPAGNYVCIVRLTDKGQIFSRTVTIVRD